MQANIFKGFIFSLIFILTACTKYDCPPTISSKPAVSCPLVADYEFNGNTDDISSYNITAINHGASLTTDRFGNPNSAYSLNGSSSYIYCDTNNRGVTSEVTVSAWIQTVAPNEGNFIVGKYNYLENHGYNFAIYSNKVKFEGRDGFLYRQTKPSTTIVTDGQWHLLTGVVRNGTWELWVDGVLESDFISGNVNTLLTVKEPLVIGYYSQNNSSFFQGTIDDVKIWPCALDSAEIVGMYSKPALVQVDTTTKTITLSGNQISSSEVRYGQYSDQNLSYSPCLAIWSIMVSSNPDIGRSFMQFDYSSIPSNAIITKATLYLYSDTAQFVAGSSKGAYGSPYNNWIISTVTAPWNASTITWNNQPVFNTTSYMNMPATTSAFENYAVDITNIVLSKINNSSSNYGIVMLQADEVDPSKGLAFYNNNGPIALQPKLVVQYK